MLIITGVVFMFFTVEWSIDEWATIGGSLEIHDLRRMSVFVDGLAQGKRHHFRVLAGNMKDYGSPLTTTPPAAIPSSELLIQYSKSIPQ